MAQGVGLNVHVVDQTQQGLTSAYNNVTKWFNKTSQKAIIEATVKFNDKNLTRYVNEFSNALSNGLKRKMKAFSFEGMYYTKTGKESGPWRSINFSSDELKNMNYDTAKVKLQQLVELRDRLANGTAMAGGEWGTKETRQLNQLIDVLTRATSSYELMLRVRQKQNTVDTTAATKTASQLEREAKATKQLIWLNEQLRTAKNQQHTAWASNDLQKQVDAHRNLADLYRKRYTLTKDIRDCERAIRHEVAASSFQARLSYEREIANQKKRQLEYERLFTSAANANNGLLSARNFVMRNLVSLMRRYVSLFTLINVGQKMAETTGFFEQQEVALEGILNSAAEARKAISEITSLALESPFQTKDLVTYTKQLSAFGVDGNLVGTMKELADISAGLGVDMGRIILAYGQVKSASVLRGQELRQFTEAGIPMVKALADKFTELNGTLVTTGEIFKLISERQVPFEMVAEVLSDMTAEGGKFNEMQARLTDTLYGQIQKLKDVWTLALKDGGSGIGGVLITIVKGLQGIIKHLPGIITAFGALTLTTGLKSISRILPAIRKYFIAFKMDWKMIGIEIHNAGIRLRQQTTLLGKAKVALRGLFGSMKSFAGAFGMAISVATGFIVDAIMKSREWKKSLEEIDISFAKDTSKMIIGFDKLIGKLSSTIEGTKAYNDAMQTLKTNYGEYVNDELINQLIKERQQLDKTTEGWGLLYESIVSAIRAKKEYERHEERRRTVSDGIVKDFMDDWDAKDWLDELFEHLTAKQADQIVGLKGKEASKTQREIESVQAVRTNERIEMFNTALSNALNMFFENGETTVEELKKRVESELNFYGIKGHAVDDLISNQVPEIFKSISKDKRWGVYIAEDSALDNDPYKSIDNAFADAKRNISLYQEGRWTSGMRNEDYNPFWMSIVEDFELSKAAKKLVSDFMSTMTEDMIAYERSDDPDVEAKNKQKGFEAYQSAAKTINTLFSTMKLSDFADADKTRQVAEALNNLLNTVGDASLRSKLTTVTDKFIELAGTKTGQAASVSSNIIAAYGDGSNADKATKDFMARYLPTDQTYSEFRKRIESEISSLENEIEGYGDIQGNEENRKYVEGLKKQLELFRILAGEDYYDIDLNKSKDSGSKSLPADVASFLNDLKNAYSRYKEAVQKLGVGAGLGYARTDQQFKEMFGQFFAGAEGEQFQGISGLKIGNKTVGELLSEEFIKEGLETGVLNFEEAIKNVIEELKAYGDTTDKGGRAYLNAAKQLEQWVETTIAKDNLSVTLEEFEKSVKDLTNSFEKTNKAVELYRQLQKNGTVGSLGANIGVNRAMALTPDSTRQASYIQELIGLYNQKATPLGAQEFSIGNLNSISDVYAAIEKIGEITKMNAENFPGSPLGNMGGDVTNLLKQLLETLIKEAQSISGDVYTGDAMQDMRANAKIKMQSEYDALTAQENIARKQGVYDFAAIKKVANATQDEAKKIFDQFIKDNRLDVIAREGGGQVSTDKLDYLEKKLENVSKDFPDALKDELMSKLTDLRSSVNDYNASIGGWGSFTGSIRDYRNADEIASEKYNTENGRNIVLRTQLESAEFAGNVEEVDRLNVELALSEERLKAMGENGKNLAEELRKASLENMQKSIQTCQSQFNSMVDSVNSVISTAKSFSQAINKVYDALNDGENPDWMKDMEGFLGDFGDAFSSLIAPIMSIISLVATLTITFTVCAAAATPLLIIMAVLIAVAAVVAGIVAAAQQHDRALQRDIEDLEKQMEDTQNAMTNLNAAAERMVGFEKFSTQLQSNAKNLELYRDALAKAKAEEDKKNTDIEKVKEFEQEAQEYHDTFLNNLREQIEEITFSIEDLASRISDAMRTAFQNGENAARAMRDVVKEAIGDMVQKMMDMYYLMPRLEEAWENYLGMPMESIEDNFMGEDGKFDWKKFSNYLKSLSVDPEKVATLESDWHNISNGLVDWYESLPDVLKEAYSYQSGSSSMSGGISGITEDTARSLEGISNSILTQQILTNKHMSDISSYLFATVQANWFKGMLESTKMIERTTVEIKDMIYNSQIGAKPLQVSMS